MQICRYLDINRRYVDMQIFRYKLQICRYGNAKSSQHIGRSRDKVMAAEKWLVVLFYGVRNKPQDWLQNYSNLNSNRTSLSIRITDQRVHCVYIQYSYSTLVCIKQLYSTLSCSDLTRVPSSLLAARAHEDVRNHLREGKQLPINMYSSTPLATHKYKTTSIEI